MSALRQITGWTPRKYSSEFEVAFNKFIVGGAAKPAQGPPEPEDLR